MLVWLILCLIVCLFVYLYVFSFFGFFLGLFLFVWFFLKTFLFVFLWEFIECIRSLRWVCPAAARRIIFKKILFLSSTWNGTPSKFHEHRDPSNRDPIQGASRIFFPDTGAKPPDPSPSQSPWKDMILRIWRMKSKFRRQNSDLFYSAKVKYHRTKFKLNNFCTTKNLPFCTRKIQTGLIWPPHRIGKKWTPSS